MEEFFVIIQCDLNKGWWKPIHYRANVFPTVHLAFVNDVMAFSKDTNEGLVGIHKYIHMFCSSSRKQNCFVIFVVCFS